MYWITVSINEVSVMEAHQFTPIIVCIMKMGDQLSVMCNRIAHIYRDYLQTENCKMLLSVLLMLFEWIFQIPFLFHLIKKSSFILWYSNHSLNTCKCVYIYYLRNWRNHVNIYCVGAALTMLPFRHDQGHDNSVACDQLIQICSVLRSIHCLCNVYMICAWVYM